jgi:hypothetical protein
MQIDQTVVHDGIEVVVRLTVDVDAIIKRLAWRAIRNRDGVARFMNAAVVVERIM